MRYAHQHLLSLVQHVLERRCRFAPGGSVLRQKPGVMEGGIEQRAQIRLLPGAHLPREHADNVDGLANRHVHTPAVGVGIHT